MTAAPQNTPPNGPIDPAGGQPGAASGYAAPVTSAGSDAATASAPVRGEVPTTRTRLVKAIIVFTVLRLGLIVVLTLVLVPFVPLLIALALAIVLQMPLAMVLFARPRAELTAALAVATASRRAERAELRAALRGRE